MVQGSDIRVVPLVYSAENRFQHLFAGISSDLLMQMLKIMDTLALFPRLPGGPLPFILLDGHGSHLILPFLEYINHPDHIWKVCFGLPNGTALWKVGDLPEQNGSWKMAMTKYKRELVKFKVRMGMPISITRTDVIPLTNKVFKDYFVHKEFNKRAIGRHVWNPLNRALLCHPEVIKKKLDEIDVDGTHSTSALTIESDISYLTFSTIASIDSLNLKTGIAGDFLTDLLQDAIKNEYVQKNIYHRYVVGKALRTQVDGYKQRMTAGFLLKNGHIVLDNEVLEIVAAIEKATVFAKDRIRAKCIEEYKTHKKAALAFFCQAELKRKSRR